MSANTTHQDGDLCSDTWTEADREEVQKLPGPIWVVGASGFIGAKLFFSIARTRSDVFAVSDLVESSWRLLHSPYDNRIACDITRMQDVNATIRKNRPRTVFNLAAYGGYERQNAAAQIHKVNYLGALNLVTALRDVGCDAFVQAGTSSEYGLNSAGPVESASLEPNSDYAVSKVATSYLMSYYGRLENFPCTHLRIYSAYGPWEERDRLVPRLISLGLQGRYPPLVDPRISRDFIYVDDCTRAFVRAALTTCRSAPGQVFNIATGIKTSLSEIVQLMGVLFNIPNEPEFGSMPNRRWDLSNWFGDPRLAHEKLGWTHRYCLEDGLRLTAEWERLASSQIFFGIMPLKSERLSAIIACYRDEQAIPIMHERLTQIFTQLGVDYEIIFINDGSPVNDEAAIRQLCDQDSHVIGVSHSRNFGSQSAFLSGMEIATGDAVILLDGDLQDPPAMIEAFYRQWKQGYEVVYGVRIKRQASWYMQMLYKAFYRVFKHLSEVEIPVDAGDFSLIDRKGVEHLLRFHERDLFVRGLRAWIGFRQVGVPYVRPERMFGRSTNKLLKNIWWAKKGIFSFSVKPLYYIQGFGLVIFAVSIALALFYLFYYLSHPLARVPGITTVVLLILGLSGVQLLSLSILGDYIGKVLEETKARPRFIRSKIMRGAGAISSETEIESLIKDRREIATARSNVKSS
jgi:nucleoside-diphosphate-sugar epimerase/glycosyltransferase involved in cell wall biosynthesis